MTPRAFQAEPQRLQPTSADFDWYNEHFKSVLEHFMPMTLDGYGLAYRHYDDFHYEVREAYFAIEWYPEPPDGRFKLSARTVVPVDRSVLEQLLRLRMADRGATVETVRAQIRVDARSFTQAGCPQLNGQVAKVPGFSLTPPRGVLWLHPPTNEFAFNLEGGSGTAQIYDGRQPLAQWAERTLEILLACGQKRR